MDFVTSILNFIPHIIILIAVILYVKKYSSVEGIIMLVGTIIGMLTSVFYTVVFPFLTQNGDYDTYKGSLQTVGTLSTLGYLAFAVGLLLAFQKVAAEKKQ